MVRFLYNFFIVILFCVFIGLSAVAYIFWQFSHDLPDYTSLHNYKPPITSRVHAGNGKLVAEFATQKRIFVPIEVVPKQVIQAFLSAEDKNFYEHPGIDFIGMLRAVVKSVKNLHQGKRMEGASTITQQVATNFLLNRDQSIRYKVRQIFLSFMIEKAFTKDEILELYLNEIYFGRVYGIAAASLHYFDKSVEELDIEEMAYLAAIIKGPSNYHPTRNKEKATIRRNWVIDRMYSNGFITEVAAENAKKKPLLTKKRNIENDIPAEYFVEEVRRQIVERYGFKGLYEGGLMVRTSLDASLQTHAINALKSGLEAYDRRHGWRGPFAYYAIDQVERLDFDAKQIGYLEKTIYEDWQADPKKWSQKTLKQIEVPKGAGKWKMAIVLKLFKKKAVIGLKDGSLGEVLLQDLKWAREYIHADAKGRSIRRVNQVLTQGDVILVDKKQESKSTNPAYVLKQIPKVQGGLIAIDPHTGRVLATVGGYDYGISEFNRVTQAKRQPGSSFKPFVYLTALLHGYTPNSVILDAPFVIEQGPGMPLWSPKNFSDTFYGPSPLRLGVEKSRNLMTVRLANSLGMDFIVKTAANFGIYDEMPPHLSMVLGAGETTLLKLTSAYAMIVNGGKRVIPTFIDRIQNRHGKTIYKHDVRPCSDCKQAFNQHAKRPDLIDQREYMIDERIAYQMVDILQGVVKRGTGVRANSLGFPVAGKTGTTNEAKDTWFIGFTPDLVVGVFVGFDEPKSLGKKEAGSVTAVPIFKKFMKLVYDKRPTQDFRVPDGLIFAEADGIVQPFLPGTEPGSGYAVNDPFLDDEYQYDDGMSSNVKQFAPVQEPQGLY